MAHNAKSLIPVCEEFSASISKTFTFPGTRGTRQLLNQD